MNRYKIIFTDQKGQILIKVCYAATSEFAVKKVVEAQRELGREIEIIGIKLLETI